MIKVVTAHWTGGEKGARRVQTFKIDADALDIRGKGDIGEPGVLTLYKQSAIVALFANWTHAILLPDGDSADAEGDGGDTGA